MDLPKFFSASSPLPAIILLPVADVGKERGKKKRKLSVRAQGRS